MLVACSASEEPALSGIVPPARMERAAASDLAITERRFLGPATTHAEKQAAVRPGLGMTASALFPLAKRRMIEDTTG
jgi:hypothetical protein